MWHRRFYTIRYSSIFYYVKEKDMAVTARPPPPAATTVLPPAGAVPLRSAKKLSQDSPEGIVRLVVGQVPSLAGGGE